MINAKNDDDESDDDKEESEQESIKVDKYAGICLYSRFHSYYDSHLHENEKEPQDIESIHLTILNELKTFASIYTCK